MKSMLLIASLVLPLALRAADDDFYFRLQAATVRSGAGIASANDVLSPALRLAANMGADLTAVTPAGSVYHVPVPANTTAESVFKSKRDALSPSAAAFIKDFSRVSSPVEISSIRGKPVELLVRWRADQPLPATASLAGIPITGTSATSGLVRLTKNGAITAADLGRLAEQLRNVATFVEPNTIFSIPLRKESATSPGPRAPALPFPDDPRFQSGEEWGMQRINAPALWSRTNGQCNVRVAIIDTGADYKHPEISGNLVDGHNFLDEKATAQDDHGHGTHCAGVIGGTGNNHVGIAGVNWKIEIMPLKAFSASGAGGTAFQLAQAFDWAIAHKAKVINASWGSPEYNDTIARAVQKAVANGIVVVAAAGNDAANLDGASPIPNYPASLRMAGVISVMAIDEQNAPASFSNYGKETVHLAAPGQHILSTWLNTGTGYVYDDGTSMAAPHVAGVVAAIWSLGAARFDAITPRPLAAQSVIAALLGMVKEDSLLKDKCVTNGYLYCDDQKLIALGNPNSAAAQGVVGTPAPTPSASNTSPAGSDPTQAGATPTGPSISVSGKLEVGAPAIGSETTGFVLRSNGTTIELRPKTPEIRRLLLGANGKEIMGEGVMTAQPGVERPNRPVLELASVRAN
jgi:subtilisin family serine protease